MFILGLDIGTTGAKAIIFDENGTQKDYGFMEYNIIHTEEGYIEQNAEDIWSIAKKVLKQTCKKYGQDVSALSLSVQGDAVVPIDRTRKAIAPVQLGMDYRGTEEAKLCAELLGDNNLFHITGMRSHPMNSIVKIYWARRHQPELYEKAWKFVTYSDYILGKLGSDEIVIDYTQASRTMAFNLRKKIWDDEILAKLDIAKDKLAIPVPSCKIVGTIYPELAKELGINPDAKLVTGGHDQTCAALGAGIIHENMALDSHGTAEVISTVFTSVNTTEKMYHGYYPCYLSLLPDLYFSFSLNHTGGMLQKWFAENFCTNDYSISESQNKNIYQYLFENMPEGPSPLMVLPYFNGSGTPTCDINQKGAILGLTLASNRFDVSKAIIESLSYEIRLNLEYLSQVNISINSLRAVGGGARTPAGLQNKADIIGLPISSLKVREAACLGAALAAGLAMNIYHDAEDATSVISIDQTYYPNELVHKMYNERYMVYKELYPAFKMIMPKI